MGMHLPRWGNEQICIPKMGQLSEILEPGLGGAYRQGNAPRRYDGLSRVVLWAGLEFWVFLGSCRWRWLPVVLFSR